jgi:hypothetical protein
MILAAPMRHMSLMAHASLRLRWLTVGSTGQRAQRAQPPQATRLEPDPAQLDPGGPRHSLEMRKAIGSVDVGNGQVGDVDRDRRCAAGEE